MCFVYPYPSFLDQKPLSKVWCNKFLKKIPELKSSQGIETSDILINYSKYISVTAWFQQTCAILPKNHVEKSGKCKWNDFHM